MQKLLTTLSIFIMLCVFSFPTFATVVFPKLPKKGGFVVDEAQLIKPEAIKQVNEMAGELWDVDTIPLIVVTIKSLSAQQAVTYSIEKYTQVLFDHWKLGYKDRNYGILVVISEGDRKARIEFGRGWDHRHDREAQNIMDNYMVPRFKEGDFSAGVVDGVQALSNLARGLELPPVKTPWWFVPAVILFFVAVIAIAYSLFKSGRSGWGWMFLVAVGLFLWFILRNAGSGSYGGSGSSGGGGATGSW